VNYQSIPVNCPFAARAGVNNYQRDGNMRVDGNQGSAPNYFPNSYDSHKHFCIYLLFKKFNFISLTCGRFMCRFGGPSPSAKESVSWHKEESSGDVARYETGDEDNFSQCGYFFRHVLGPEERERLTDNIAGSLVGAQEFLQLRVVANFAAADQQYGKMVKDKLLKLKLLKDRTTTAKASSVPQRAKM